MTREEWVALRAAAREAAGSWHGGQWSALYAFCSSGSAMPGVVREIAACRRDLEALEGDAFSSAEDVSVARAELLELERFSARLERSIFPGDLLEAGDFFGQCGPYALRALLDEAKDAARRPGRYVNPMAFVLDACCSHQGCEDDQTSCEASGEWAGLYGRYVLHQGSEGFLTADRYRSLEDAAAALEALRVAWGDGGDDGCS